MAGIASLDAWNRMPSDRFVSLTDTALQLAANLWAQARNSGASTADPKELDCDVLIASQALDYQNIHGIAQGGIIMATVNVGHLKQFVRADLWQNIHP